MPSFDIVSKVDIQEVDNAVNSVLREVAQRFDFKGSNCTLELDDNEITVKADDDYKLDQIQLMLKGHFTKRKIDAKSLDFGKPEMASGNSVRQKITVKQGIDSDTAKLIVKEIKNSKIKVQASIRGEEVRVDGKKRDDLQNVISMIKESKLDLPLQFINFRD
ncbi:MAG: YajQ family cyclic di-GMP-binding protein [Rickettsiales bacterium]|nr:YajQ family cyclic di-GMP-binding protein [Pseudomonadota bacterium]MDA0966189.1 YajQ family cyclic di-GMP-binding protein [Pseudomonadota bacterium]MDG4543146.1 YajQ family cyclic di-GMP-binding protein [Rickettsiales bacterium]MDG4545344.1 YajQ family cyclic di-GMP-binding protein [Rickettsiales bacterium]MDG4547793.1 YajQ family cyclic di-GMP-binding protein [Rickettsiales bacterium]